MPRPISSSLAIVFIMAARAAPLSAAPMADMDMASLWRLADIVVEGQEQEYKTENHWQHGSLIVTKVHKGEERVKAGDKIDIALMIYSRKTGFSDAAIETSEVVMFLKWNETGDTFRPGRRYLPVPSGIKLIKDDKVFRFQQLMNPGPYSPVLQGPERIERSQLQKRKTTAEFDRWKEIFPGDFEARAYLYDREALRKDLALAAAHAESLAAAIEAKDLSKLAAFLPVSVNMAMTGYYEDASGNIMSDIPASEKERAALKARIFVRRDYTDAVALAAAEAFIKLADRGKIIAALAEHKDTMTWAVRHMLEAAAKEK